MLSNINSILLLIQSKLLDFINQIFDLIKWSILKPEIDEIIHINHDQINLALPMRMRKGVVKRFSFFIERNRRFPNGRSIKGNWDKDFYDINKIERINILRKIFSNYKSTEKKKLHIYELEKWLISNSHKNLKEIKKEISNIDRFYNSIIKFGFKSYNYKNFFFFKYKEKSGIRISIGRNGEIFWCGSHHRMAIVKALKLNNVPAIVLFRHYEWQNKRLQMVKKNSFVKFEKHPDIKKFINE